VSLVHECSKNETKPNRTTDLTIE